MGADDRRADPVEVTTRGLTRLAVGRESISLRPRERAVLAAIAAGHPRPVSADEVIRRVWGDEAPRNARQSLHNHLSRIRGLGHDVVRTTEQGYELAPHVRVDHLGGELDATPLGDLADDVEVEHLRRAIDEQWAIELARQLRDSVDEPDAAMLAAARRLTDRHPVNEEYWHLLATMQSSLGQRRDALTTIRSAQRALSTVGLALDDRLVTLETELLRGLEPTSSVAHPSSRPVRLHPHRAEPFVGRRRELRLLHDAWAGVLDDRAPHLVVVRGPAGIGKTRLVDEFVRAVVDGDSPPRVVASRERHDDDRSLGSITDLMAAMPVPATPGTAGPAPSTNPAVASDDDTDIALRNRVDAAIAELATMPTIWCVDDLQWMVPDALRLVAHALEEAIGPLLVVATYRSGELDAPGALDRRLPTTPIDLAPMAVEDLEALITAWETPLASDGDVAGLHDRTAGLPLFASELARDAHRLDRRIDVTTIPAALHDWVSERLRQLDDAVIDVALTAAVLGNPFDLDVLVGSVGLPDEQLDRSIDDLVERGLIATTHEVDLLQFSHAITHEVALAMQGPASRRRRHANVAEAIRDRPAPESAEWHASLAFHLHRGGGDNEAIRRHATAACDHRLAEGAWSAAAAAIDLALSTAPGRAEHAALLARCGRVQLRLQQFDEAATSLYGAIDIAKRAGLAEIQGRAALDLTGRAGRGAAISATDDERVGLLRDALGALEGSADTAPELLELRSELERELAFAMLLGGDVEERTRLLKASLARVEQLSPRPSDTYASAILAQRYVRLAPDALDDRLDDLERVLAMGDDMIGAQNGVMARTYLVEDLLRAGRVAEAHRAVADARTALRAYPDPYWTWALATWEVVLAIHAGDVERAEQLAFSAMELAGGSGGGVACLGVNLTDIRLFQGRAGEMIGALSGAVDEHPEVPAYRAVLALCASESGDAPLAAACLDWFRQADFANLPDDTNRPLALVVLAHTAADLGDEDAMRSLMTLVKPQAGQLSIIAVYGGGGAYWGPSSHALARLAAGLGDTAADAWFDHARRDAAGSPLVLERIERHARAGARTSA